MPALVPPLRNLFAIAGLSGTARREVLRRMRDPQRHYHDPGHIALLWRRHRRFGRNTPTHAPLPTRLIACAIAFHDAVYDPMRKDNEKRSAMLWRRCAPADLPQREVDWVAETIEATANHLAPYPADTARERLRLWMLDLDLTPLGEVPPVFARNTHALRQEFRRLPLPDWESGRLRFLRGLNETPRLYRSHVIARSFERQARRNIARELAKEDQ